MTDDTFDKETVAEILDAHDVDSVDELPQPVQNNIAAGPAAEYDPFEFFRARGGD